jgi:hypothetical protein
LKPSSFFKGDILLITGSTQKPDEPEILHLNDDTPKGEVVNFEL